MKKPFGAPFPDEMNVSAMIEYLVKAYGAECDRTSKPPGLRRR
jgi:hypothetical protein